MYFDFAVAAFNAPALLFPTNFVITPHVAAVAAPLAIMEGVGILERYRQLNKIAKGEWVISDRGDAIKNVQKEDAPKLAETPHTAMIPVRIDR